MDNYEYLKKLKPKWWQSDDIVITVAHILNEEEVLTDVDDTITFFEKPWAYEDDIRKIIEDHEEEEED